jgi:2-polyprenyl-6-methoxyphenol hydroxylase-like FAD-dependent oxidoreductase
MRVLVAGGGIGGLCLAQGLHRAGVEVVVYERDPRPGSVDRRYPSGRLDGFRLHLNPAGSRALHACLTPAGWQRFLATAGDPGGGFTFLTEHLGELVHVDERLMYGEPTDPAERAYPVDRGVLRQVLLSDVEAAVRFGTAVERYEVRSDGRVTVHLAGGGVDTGDVLVGADGSGSRVRRRCHPDGGRAGTGAFAVGARLPLTAPVRQWLPARLATGMAMVFAPAPYFLFTAVFDRGRGADGYLLCAFVCRDDLRPSGATRLPGPELRTAVGALIRNWHPDLRRVLAECDPDTMTLVGLASSTPPATPAEGPVTLLGDAAHTMPPVAGLGGNTALRDAYLLAQQLVAVDRGRLALPAAIAAYESRMRRYGTRAVEASLRTQRQGLADGRFATAAARGWFRGCAAVPLLRRLTFGGHWAAPARRLPWEAAGLAPA